jgi:hypothetical protein
MLRTELSIASNSGQVGCDINNHLSQLAAATLNEHSEIGPILEKYGFRQGEFAAQFCTQLSSKDMNALAHDLILTNSLNIWLAEDTSDEMAFGYEFLRGLRAQLLKASNSMQVGPQVIKYLGELTTVTLDVHPEIRSILEKYGPIQGKSADHLYTQLSSEDMFALANDLLLTNHTGSMLYPKVSSEVQVEDTKETVQWRCERVLVMVLEHDGKPLNKPGMITSLICEH